MAEILKPKKAPVVAAEITPEWITGVKDAVQREKYLLRGGPGSSIEVFDQGIWYTLNLPGDTVHFVSDADRDAIIVQLSS